MCLNIFTSYLWGIETSLNNLFDNLCDNSHPTYEELKPQKQHVSGWGTCQFTSYLWGIETDPAETSSRNQDVIHILPMRNWNSPLRTICPCASTIHILPMRNWNSPSTAQCLSVQSIHILPMRNWNFLNKVFPCHLWLNSHPTYEELKHFQFLTSLQGPGLFTSYLWGIETLVHFHTGHRLSVIHILPMRNWNLCVIDW